MSFVVLFTTELEEPYNLKLCVDERDFLVGSYKYIPTARIMEERFVYFLSIWLNTLEKES